MRSAANIQGVNDHLRTGLVKPCFGSLTISVLVFLATLVYRKKVDQKLALALNVVLASPELNGDWPSVPYLVDHVADIPALLAIPLSLLSAGTMSPATASL
eukprot:g12321.t1